MTLLTLLTQAARRARLPLAGLVVLALAALFPALASAEVQSNTLHVDPVTPAATVTVMRPDGTPIMGTTKVGKLTLSTPDTQTSYVGYCVDPDHVISENSDYDVLQSWDGSPSGGVNDLPQLNGRRAELAWLLYNTDDLLNAAGDQRDARSAALQIAVWQELGLASESAPVDPLSAPDVAGQLAQVRQALESRTAEVPQNLSLAASATSASVCGGPNSVVLTVTGAPGSQATVEVVTEPSPATAQLSGGAGVSPAPDGRSATVTLDSGGRRSLMLTGATPGQVAVQATARGMRLVHWRGKPGTGSENMQQGVYALRGMFGGRVTVNFTGCAQPVAPAPQSAPAAPETEFTPAYVPSPKARLAFSLRGLRQARTGQTVAYVLRIVNASPRLTARRVRVRYTMPRGLSLPRGQRWASAVTVRGRTLTVDVGDMRPGTRTTLRLQLVIGDTAVGFRRAEAVLSARNAVALHRTVTTQVRVGRAVAARAARRTATGPATPSAPAPVAGTAAAGASAWR